LWENDEWKKTAVKPGFFGGENVVLPKRGRSKEGAGRLAPGITAIHANKAARH